MDNYKKTNDGVEQCINDLAKNKEVENLSPQAKSVLKSLSLIGDVNLESLKVTIAASRVYVNYIKRLTSVLEFHVNEYTKKEAN